MKYNACKESPFASAETVRLERRGEEGKYFYVINETNSRYITFEEINGIYIKKRCRSVYCCSVSMKSGEYQICNLIEDDFWAMIEGKEFTVVVDESTRKILPSPQETSKETVDRLFHELDSGNESILDEMTMLSPCFQLIEI